MEMETQLKISIVTISFNQVRFVEQAIQSVIDQDYPHVEYIIVDPGSTDGSRDIVERYRDRIDQIIFEQDEGPADGLNKGFAIATGNVFGFINADDALLTGALTYVANYFQSHLNIDVLLGAGFVVDESDRILWPILPSRFSTRRYVTGAFEFIQQGMYFRREAFLAAGGFNVRNRTCWDGELLLDMGLAGMRFGRCPENLGLFRLYKGSISGGLQVSGARARDQDRLFRKVLKRKANGFDWVIGFWLRLAKWSSRPLFYGMRFIKYGRSRSYRNKLSRETI